jgi:hypothetical protein
LFDLEDIGTEGFGHMVRKWQNWDLNPGWLILQSPGRLQHFHHPFPYRERGVDLKENKK